MSDLSDITNRHLDTASDLIIELLWNEEMRKAQEEHTRPCLLNAFVTLGYSIQLLEWVLWLKPSNEMPDIPASHINRAIGLVLRALGTRRIWSSEDEEHKTESCPFTIREIAVQMVVLSEAFQR